MKAGGGGKSWTLKLRCNRSMGEIVRMKKSARPFIFGYGYNITERNKKVWKK